MTVRQISGDFVCVIFQPDAAQGRHRLGSKSAGDAPALHRKCHIVESGEAAEKLGDLKSALNDYDRAIEIYQKVMTKLPKDAALWFDLGQCHHRRKDFNESARCFQKALELDPENRDYLKRYGLTLAWIGQTEQGLVYLTRAQGAALAHVNIAGLMLTRGRHDLAMHHVQLALRENQQLPAALDLLARLEGGPTGAPQ